MSDRASLRKILRAIKDGRAVNLRRDGNTFDPDDWLFDLPGDITVNLWRSESVIVSPAPSGTGRECIGYGRACHRIRKALAEAGVPIEADGNPWDALA